MDFEYFIGSKWNNFDWFIELWNLVEVKWGKRIPKWKTYFENFVGYKYLRVDDLDENGLFIFDNLKNIDEEVYNSIKNYFIEKNNLCVSIAGTIWKIALIEEDFNKKLILTENCAKLIIKDKNIILPKYLKFILKSDISQNQFESNYWQATIAKLSLERLKQTKIPVPSLKIQQQIVEKIDKALLEKQTLETKNKETLESIDEYILWELGIKLPEQQEEKMCFSIDLEDVKNGRFDVFYNKPEFISIEKQLSNSNKVISLGDIIDKIKTWTTPSTKENPFTNQWMPFFRNTNLRKNEILMDDVKYVKKEFENKLTYSENDEIIICIAWTIWVCAVNDFGRMAINQNVSALKLKDWISPHFVSYLLNTEMFSWFFERVSSVATIKYINNENLLSIKIPLPPIEMQNKIADEVNNRIKEAKTKEQQAKEIYEKAKKEVEEIILN